MKQTVFIAEKPSVAIEFAKALKVQTKKRDGYLEGNNTIFTWCVGHLITMSYPEAYDPALKRWSLNALPFLPEEFKYEVIPAVKKQYEIVKGILTHPEVETIYVCTDSGREGEYIYRLVEQHSGVKGKKRRRIWIDSQTEDEILRGIKEAKDLSEYDNLSASAYLRAKEDYLMGINFSRLLSLKYGNDISAFLNTKYSAISVGRVMTCVLGMVVSREREIRDFVKTPFYRVLGDFHITDRGETYSDNLNDTAEEESYKPNDANNKISFQGEWRVNPKSKYFESPHLYKENGFKERTKALELIELLGYSDERAASEETLFEEDKKAVSKETKLISGEIVSLEKKKEKKNPPLLYNLAELQNDCAKRFKISPDETLRIAQELYEKKLITYPRTDARVLSSAVAKEISKNLNGLMKYPVAEPFLQEIVALGSHKNLAKTRVVNDKQITDHYAIIPTGEGFLALKSVNTLGQKVYNMILRRFLGVFYPPAVYQKIAVTVKREIDDLISKRKEIEDLISKRNEIEDIVNAGREAGVVTSAKSETGGAIVTEEGIGEVTEYDEQRDREGVIREERFYANVKVLVEEGYLKVLGNQTSSKEVNDGQVKEASSKGVNGSLINKVENRDDGQTKEGNTRDTRILMGAWDNGENSQANDLELYKQMSKLKKGDKLHITNLQIKEGETSPPKRYNSGSLILAMENAGQFIEDEELRAQIKGSGIGTSATRAEIQKKLVNINYLNLNKKTQIITPTLQGEMVYDVVRHSISSLLNPELTASWEKGLGYVAVGEISSEEYIIKLNTFVRDRTNQVKGLNNQYQLQSCYRQVAKYYRGTKNTEKADKESQE